MPKNMFIQSVTKNIVDPDTGEMTLIETEKLHKVTLSNVEEFFQIYCKILAPLYELKYADDIKLLIKFCEIATFNTGEVLLPAPRRKEICEEMNLQSSNMSKCIKRLKEKQLIDGDRGVYVINPKLFWKGTQKEREKLLQSKSLKLTFEFSTES
jgi:hypothetical protein